IGDRRLFRRGAAGGQADGEEQGGAEALALHGGFSVVVTRANAPAGRTGLGDRRAPPRERLLGERLRNGGSSWRHLMRSSSADEGADRRERLWWERLQPRALLPIDTPGARGLSHSHNDAVPAGEREAAAGSRRSQSPDALPSTRTRRRPSCRRASS